MTGIPRPTRREKLTGVKEANGNKEHDKSSMALLDPYGYLYKEISCTLRLTLIKGIPIRKGSYQLRAFIRIFPKRKDPLRQEMIASLPPNSIGTLRS